MSATLYSNELGHIISESKRKNAELRTSAETSLQELKSITVTSEQQLAADLSRKPTFVEPFLKACATGQTKFAISGVNGLQRLVISQGLPKSRLSEALLAFNVCAELSLDVQLKVLQALPSLVQNYSEELRGDQLGSALQVCAALQGAKVSTVSAVAAATLQQLVGAVFARLAEEDKHASSSSPTVDVPGVDGNISLRPAAHDAYRVLRDLVLAAEGRKTKFVQLSTLTREECLELIKSSLEAKPHLIEKHEELASVIRSNVMPLATSSISENMPFATTVRSIRLLSTLIFDHFDTFRAELEVTFGLFAHALESESSPIWKRILLMEVLRDVFNEHDLIVQMYLAFDRSAGGKPIVQDTLAAFVRLSAEKPAVIGLGQQSSTPTGPSHKDDSVSDLTHGMATVLSSLGVVETNIQGISEQWSIPKAPCYDQLDKHEAPALPETYIYSLVLQSLSGLSENLARIVLPLSVQHDHGTNGANNDDKAHHQQSVPLNPLTREDKPPTEAVQAVAGLIETCWPAVLAACSTFMNAALDDAFYRSLIKSYQRFAQVAGLLRLYTPRDALMTTLGKSAVPPQVLNAATTENNRAAIESPRSVSSPKSLLSIDGLVGQAAALTLDKDRRSSADTVKAVLTVRNLLCLRALLNLAIALGPTLGAAFAMVLDVVKHADIVLSAAGPPPLSRVSTSSSLTQSDPPAIVQSFSSEVTAVENAASRLLESTADYPDEAFVMVLRAFCDMLKQRPVAEGIGTIVEEPKTPSTPLLSPIPRHRTFSGLPGLGHYSELRSKNLQFALPKLGTLAALNVPRFVSSSIEESGWEQLTHDVLAIVVSNANASNARRSAADLLTKLAAECIFEVAEEDEALRSTIQQRCLTLLLHVINGIYDEDGELTSIDLEIQSHVINCLKTILERTGDSLIAGWDKVIATLSTSFESDRGAMLDIANELVEIRWEEVSEEFVSLRLGRDAFATLQLICADFFAQTPIHVRGSIIELLYRFMAQSEDLNLSLTSITISWTVADLLFGSEVEESLIKTYNPALTISELEQRLWASAKTHAPVQWILLLVKLRRIVARGQREAARAAFQTICSIGKNNGAQLPQPMWDVVIRHVLVGVLADDADAESKDDRDLTTDLLQGAATSLADQVRQATSSPNLEILWTEWIRICSKILDRTEAETSTAVYAALATILSNIRPGHAAWQTPLAQVSTLWSTKDAVSAVPSTARSNQPAFVAYADVAKQILRLGKENMSFELGKALIDNLCNCVERSDATVYSADSQSMSELQNAVLGILKTIPRDIQHVLPQMLVANAKLVKLPLHQVTSGPGGARPSFVALAAEVMQWDQDLIQEGINNTEVLKSEALHTNIAALADVVEQKYHFQVDHKGVSLWRRATAVLVAVAGPVLASTSNEHVSHDLRLRIWEEYVRLAGNVVLANSLESFQDVERTYSDEQSDILAFQKLQEALIPGLGSEDLPNDLLITYARSLFQASIIHDFERGEAIPEKPLTIIGKIRRGRSKQILPSRREDMAYECFRVLIELSSTTQQDTGHERRRLASSTAALLVLRLAIPIRSYIADQPLRGRTPQPLSELEELLYCFSQIQKIKLLHGVLGESGSERNSQPHIRYLYPLLAQSVRVAGDKRCGTEEVLSPLQEMLASLIF